MDIKSVIKAHGETTYSLAEKMGISQPSLSSIINGNPTAKKLEEVAKALGCSPAEFFADWKSGAEELPFDNNPEQPAPEPVFKADGVGLQQAIVCPHCQKAIKITVG